MPLPYCLSLLSLHPTLNTMHWLPRLPKLFQLDSHIEIDVVTKSQGGKFNLAVLGSTLLL